MNFKPPIILLATIVAILRPGAEAVELLPPSPSPDIRHSDAELLGIVAKALEKRKSTRSIVHRKKSSQAFAEVLKPLSDAEKTRAIMLQLCKSDQGKPMERLFDHTVVPYCSIITNVPEMIQDTSELRRMMKEETNPRRFYFLEWIAIRLAENLKTDFIPLMSRMLLRNDPSGVSAYDGSSRKVLIGDQCYQAILCNMKSLGVEYMEPEHHKVVSHSERRRMLAAWLRENWPGCENLGVADKSAPSAPDPENRLRSRPSARGTPSGAPDQPAAPGAGFPAWILATSSLLVLAAALAAWLKFRHSNR